MKIKVRLQNLAIELIELSDGQSYRVSLMNVIIKR